jgi:hypothetical protein
MDRVGEYRTKLLKIQVNRVLARRSLSEPRENLGPLTLNNDRLAVRITPVLGLFLSSHSAPLSDGTCHFTHKLALATIW